MNERAGTWFEHIAHVCLALTLAIMASAGAWMFIPWWWAQKPEFFGPETILWASCYLILLGVPFFWYGVGCAIQELRGRTPGLRNGQEVI